MSDPINVNLTKKVISVTTQGRGLRGYGVEIDISDEGMIQWRSLYTGAPWNDIVAVSALKGDQGTASHLHIKWHAEGSETLLDTPDSYIGIYADNTVADSAVYADYQWFKYKGDKGDKGDDPELQIAGGYIQWKTTTEITWHNLIAVASLIGAKGDTGDNPQIQVAGGYIQWKLSEESTWNNLVEVISLKGDKGDAAPNTQAQYKAYASDTWVNAVPDNCQYMKLSYDNGTTWSGPIEFASVAALALKAPLKSPAFTDTPTAPTAPQGTNTTQLATCAHVFQAMMEGDWA